MKRHKRRVVVTGMGAITPAGRRAEEMWQNLKEAKSSVSDITLFDASTFNTRIAAEIRNFNFQKEFKGYKKDAHLDRLNRHAQFAMMAAYEAYQDSKLGETKQDPERFGVYFASGEGGVDFINYANCTIKSINKNPSEKLINKNDYILNSHETLDGIVELEQEPGMTLFHLTDYFGAKGPSFNCLTACAASSQAIGESAEIIRRGEADVMMTGGAHSMIHPLGVLGFNLLTALSTSNDEPEKASRPFDLKRNGFVLGEGSGVLILEELECALNRGAKIYGEVTGYGSTADAYRLTDSHPEGRGASDAIRMALEDSDNAPGSIDYISAHGTSTFVNDSIETLSIKQAFGEKAKDIPVSSVKSMMGHLITAAGVTEFIICLLAIRDGIVPPTINYENEDPECDLDYVPNKARKMKVDKTLSNSFGFGGQNIALIAERFVK
jgi:3-oxoacyl-[acyl-carrier-protein] synthase II